MMTTLCDTSFLVALLGEGSGNQEHYRSVFNKVDKPLLVTWPCVAEAMHLIGKRGGGWSRQQILLELLNGPIFEIFEIEKSAYVRLIDLMEKYQDRPMDFADASLVLAAEQTNQYRILTLDSDFLFYRISGRDSFELIAF